MSLKRLKKQWRKQIRRAESILLQKVHVRATGIHSPIDTCVAGTAKSNEKPEIPKLDAKKRQKLEDKLRRFRLYQAPPTATYSNQLIDEKTLQDKFDHCTHDYNFAAELFDLMFEQSEQV